MLTEHAELLGLKNEDSSQFLKRSAVKEILRKLLNGNDVHIEESLWPRIMAFAEKEGLVDFKFMLEVFKD